MRLQRGRMPSGSGHFWMPLTGNSTTVSGIPPINADALRHIAEPQGFRSSVMTSMSPSWRISPMRAGMSVVLPTPLGPDDGAASLRDRGVDVLKDGEPAPAHGYVAEDDGVSWFKGALQRVQVGAHGFRNSPAVRWPGPLRRGPACRGDPGFTRQGWRQPCPDTAVP